MQWLKCVSQIQTLSKQKGALYSSVILFLVLYFVLYDIILFYQIVILNEPG